MTVVFPAVEFVQVVLAVHIMAVVAGLGVIFAYPLFVVVGRKLDPRAMPWYHRMQQILGQRLISPSLVVILIAGIYLASKLHMWSYFFVQFGMVVVIVLGGIGGAFMAPRERRLAELAERDIAAAGDGEVVWSAEYETLEQLVGRVGAFLSLLVLIAIYVMSVQA